MSLMLNLGCGDERLNEYVNIDLRADVADEIADCRHLPYVSETVDAIVAHDLLEHFPSFQTADVLEEWHRVLKPGATLRLRVPNLDALSQKILMRSDDLGMIRLLIRNVYGGHRWGDEGELDMHHTGWTPFTLADDLRASGFRVESNDEQLNMTVIAVKQ